MATQRLFGEDQLAVDGHFKFAAGAGDELPGGHKGFDLTFSQNFARQTDSALGIVSDGTVFERDVQQRVLHEILLKIVPIHDIIL